jgi:hypothetical protein
VLVRAATVLVRRGRLEETGDRELASTDPRP